MDNNTIFSKSAKGLREATGATSELARSLRAVLKEVDGKKSFAELRQKFGKYSDAEFQQAMRTLELDEYVRDTLALTQIVVPFNAGQMGKRVADGKKKEEGSLDDLDFTSLMTRIDENVLRQDDEERAKREAVQKAELLALAKAKRDADDKTRRESVERAKREAEVKAKQALLAKARQEAEEQARLAALETAKREAAEAARVAAEAATRREAEETARKEAEERARREAEERARRAAAEKAKREADERARKFAEERAIQAAEARAKQEAEEKLKREEEERRRQEAIALARKEAEEKARLEAEAKAAVEEKARIEAELAARKAAEEKTRLEAETAERAAAEARQKKEAEEKARSEAEATARQAAEAQARREAEDKARLAAEALKVQEAEEKERREAEAAARKAAEEQARRDAEARARQEAEERDRQAAEALALKAAEEATERRLAEEKARREAELAAQKAAHEAARLKEEDEARSQRDAELRAQQEAEARLRREADEEKARLVVEARIKQEAEESAQREAEAEARREAEEQARREAAAEAQRVATAAARAAEEEQVRIAAKAREQKEAERLAVWERTKLKAEAKLRQEAEEKQQREAKEKEQAEREAAEQAAEEAEARAVAKAAERAEALKVAEQAASRQADMAAKASDRSELEMDAGDKSAIALREVVGKLRQPISMPFGSSKSKDDAQDLRSTELDDVGERRKVLQEVDTKTEELVAKMKARTSRFSDVRWGKVMAFVVVIVSLAVARMHFESFDSRIPELKQMASAQFKQPVTIGAVYFSLFPRPQWQLEDVAIGDDAQASIPVINATLDLGKILSRERWAFDSITLTAPTLNEEILAQTFFSKSTAQTIKTKTISAKGVYIKSPAIDMPRFDVKAEIGPDGNWKTMVLDIANREVFVDMFPEADRIRFEATAITFLPPFGGTFAFNDFRAKGSFARGELVVSEFEGRNFGGAFTGNAAMSWTSGWRMDGVVNAKQPNAKNLAPALVGSGHVDGKATFSMQAPDAKTLFAAPRLEGGFTVGEGTLLGVDLMSRVQNTTNTGKTQFRRLSGSFVREGTSTVFRQVRLDAGMLSAAGGAVLDANNVLNGRFTTNLSFDNQQRSAAVVLTGTLDKPRFAR